MTTDVENSEIMEEHLQRTWQKHTRSYIHSRTACQKKFRKQEGNSSCFCWFGKSIQSSALGENVTNTRNLQCWSWDYQRYYKLLQELPQLYKNFNKTSSEFNTSAGVRQGDILSPYLFVVLMDAIIKESQQRSRTVSYTHLDVYKRQVKWSDAFFENRAWSHD